MYVVVKNKKAYFDYNILDKHVAGIKLLGTEVKAIRDNKVSIAEAYCYINEGEAYIKGMHISEYSNIGMDNHAPVRDRKLLLKKKEIEKLAEAIKIKSLTLIPLCIMISATGFIKVELGLGKGKKNFDKRESIKEKDIKRDTQKQLK